MKHVRLRDGQIAFILFFLAFILRFVRALLTPVVNVDAPTYLYQAKAIYYGYWTTVNSCYYPHVTLLPPMAALFYPIFQDWIWAMRAVSILFGSLTIIPLYFLGRLFFDRPIAFITTFVYAVLHVFVSASVDIIRDPAAWFFITMGLFTFALSLKRDKKILLCASSIFFILATWNRFESIFFPLISIVFLLFRRKEGKGRIIAFLTPFLVVITASILYYLISQKMPNLYRLNEIWESVKVMLKNYQTIRSELAKLSQNPPPGWGELSEFFRHSRTLLLYTALGAIIHSTV
ncbi:MAG: glycosyltransferase family 39 protein, partial [Syntrophales bacterium]|nr:glycosyltransferase family 39 protein [Syntrophales bacterium]